MTEHDKLREKIMDIAAKVESDKEYIYILPETADEIISIIQQDMLEGVIEVVVSLHHQKANETFIDGFETCRELMDKAIKDKFGER